MSYEDSTLLKLRRDYSKDEVVMYALKKIQGQQVEIGKLNSYIAELEDGTEGIKDKLLQTEIERNKNLSLELNQLRVDIKHKESSSKNENKLHMIRTLQERLNSAVKSEKLTRRKKYRLKQ